MKNHGLKTKYLLCDETILIIVNIIEPVSEAFSALCGFWLEQDPELKMRLKFLDFISARKERLTDLIMCAMWPPNNFNIISCNICKKCYNEIQIQILYPEA